MTWRRWLIASALVSVTASAGTTRAQTPQIQGTQTQGATPAPAAAPPPPDAASSHAATATATTPTQVTSPGDPQAAQGNGFDLTRVKLTGFFTPMASISYREIAVPRDRLTLGMVSSRVGLRLAGNPYDQWSYMIELGFDAAVLNNRTGGQKFVSDVSLAGSAAGTQTITTRYQFTTAVSVEQAWVAWQPIRWYTLMVGRMRAPFSVAHGATITQQMFPTRAGPATVFMNGADEGLLNSLAFVDERIQVKAGAFNGTSLGLQLPNTTSIGPVFLAVTDVHPLGKMPPMESDSGRGPFRFAAGVGALYRIGTLFDDKGYEATRFRDLRFSATLRAAWRGLFLQSEFLRRVQTDDLSLRPSTARGFYAQGAWYIPFLGRFAAAPIARWGTSTQDEQFTGLKITSYEGGAIFYPRADLPEPDSIRITLQYVGEERAPAKEIAHGALMQLFFKW